MTSALPSAVESHQNAYNSRSGAKVAELYAEDGTYQDPLLPQAIKGKGAVKAYLEGLFSAFPDFAVKNVSNVVSGDSAVLINTAGGTFKGPIRNPDGTSIPPTNRKFTGEYPVLFHLNKTGKIQSVRIYGDSLDIFKQLGIKP